MKKQLTSLVFSIGFPICFNATASELNLNKLIELAEHNDHRLSAHEMRETASKENISSAESSYYPKLKLEALQGFGFPGSAGLTEVGGVMVSPYHAGPSLGLLSTYTFDFGQSSHKVAAARHEFRAQEEEAKLSRIEIDQEATRLFFSCIRYRTESENWKFVLEEAKLVADEVGHFVKTGQRSIVESYLAKSQVEEALTAMSDFEERHKLSIWRMGVLTGVDPKNFECPTSDNASSLTNLFQDGDPVHPLISKSEEEAKAAEERLKVAKAERLPKLIAVGSFGAFEASRVVAKENYSFAVGFHLPLFDGWKITSEERHHEAIVSEKAFLIQAEREHIDQTNAKFDEVINASRERLKHIQTELGLSKEGFEVAKKRYFKLQGLLVDVREALRNYTRVKSQRDETQIDLAEASISKSIFNGGKIK